MFQFQTEFFKMFYNFRLKDGSDSKITSFTNIFVTKCNIPGMLPLSVVLDEISITSIKFFELLSLHKKWSFPLRIFFGKCDQIHRELWIWLHLLKKLYFLFSVYCLKKNGLIISNTKSAAEKSMNDPGYSTLYEIWLNSSSIYDS